jgi:hypothetical protein
MTKEILNNLIQAIEVTLEASFYTTYNIELRDNHALTITTGWTDESSNEYVVDVKVIGPSRDSKLPEETYAEMYLSANLFFSFLWEVLAWQEYSHTKSLWETVKIYKAYSV